MEKNVSIWNKFGKDICEYYNHVEKVGIKYTEVGI
jgi:hypothetical protein